MDNFTLKVLAGLDKALSKRMIKNDLKSIDNQFTVKVIARLNKALSQKALKQTLKELTNLNVNVNAKLNKSVSEAQLRQQVKALQAKITDLNLRLKADTGQLNSNVKQAASSAQRVADQAPIEYKVTIKKEKLVSDLALLAKQNSKLFTNAAATQKYGKLLDDAYGASTGTEIQELTLRMAAFKSELKAANLSGLTLSDTFKKTVGRAGELVSATSMIMTALSQARKAYTEVKELDDSMTGLYKVADEIRSRDDFPAYLDKSIQKAKELAVETKSLISSITDWKKIGFSLGVSEKLAEVATKLEKTGDMSIEKATSTLISTLQAFKEIDGLTEDQYSERALAIADKINNISNTRSIDAEGISDALQNSVATLQEANNDLNQSIAMIAAGNKVFQSPSEVGNMLKIVSMRLRNITEDGEQAEESVAKLRSTILNLTNNQVDIMLDENTFKSTYDILLEISRVYDTLSDKSQALLLEKIAGKQRGASTAALLQNMAEAEMIYKDSLNSVGSVNQEFERYQESASAAVTRFKETLVDTYTGILNGDMIIGAANAGSAILELSNRFNLLQSSIVGIAAVGAVKGITAIGTACLSSAKQMNVLGDAINRVNSLPTGNRDRQAELYSIGKATKSLSDKQLKLLLSNNALEESDRIRILRAQNLSPELAKEKLATLGLAHATDTQTAANVKATTSTFSLKAAVTGLGASMKAAFMSNPIGISLMAISVAIGAVVGEYQKYRQELEETREKNIQASESAYESAKSLDALYTKYKELNSIQERNASQEEDFKGVIVDITKALGEKGVALKELTVGTEEYTKALENATKQELESFYVTSVTGRKAAEEQLKENSYSVWKGSKVKIDMNPQMTGVKEHMEALNVVRDILSEFEHSSTTTVGGGLLVDNSFWDTNSSDIENVVEYYDKLSEARKQLILVAQETGNEALLNSDIYKGLDTTIGSLSESVDTYISKRYQELKAEYEWKNSVPMTTDELKLMEEGILANANAGEYLSNQIRSFLQRDFSNLSQGAGQAADAVNNLKASFSLTDHKDSIDNFQEKVNKLQEYLKELPNMEETKRIDMFQDFPELMNMSGNLEDAIKSLIHNALDNLYNSIDTTLPDNLKDGFERMAESAVNAQNEIEDLEKELSQLNSIQTILSKGTDNITLENLKSIQDYGKQYKELVDEYILGVTDEKGFLSNLKKLYETDLTNYQRYMMNKYSNSETFWNSIVKTDHQLINSFADNYGVDISNCKTYAESKLKIEKELLSRVKDMWSQYYNAQSNSLTVEGARLQQAVNQARNAGVSDAVNPYAKQLNEILGAQEAYKEAMKALDSITFDKITSDIPKLSSDFDLLNENLKDREKAAKEVSEYNKNLLDAELNFLGAKLDAGKINFEQYAQRCKSLIDDMYKHEKISAEDYFEYTQKMLEKQKGIYDKVLSSVTRRLDKEIQKNEDIIDSIEKQNDALEKQKDKYDKVISAVQTLIDTKKEEIQSSIDSLEKENEALNKQVSDYDSVLNAVQKVYEEKQEELKAEQDAIQERIDSLQEENDEHKRAIELQKAKYELERSMNQRSQFVFDGEQFVYQVDDQSIQENQEKVSDLELEQTISNMEKEKEALQGLIDELDKYKNLWAETANAYQDIIDKELAKNILGENYDQEILLNRIEDIEAFKNRYIAAQEKIDDNTSLIKSYNEKLEYYENLKKKWEDLSSAKEESTNRQIASELLGQEWEALILEDRLTSFEEFADTYLSIQDQIDDNTSLIESYNEKITYYENLKQQWSDISDAYQNAVDDQYAAMILGQNWEADVLSGRIETLNNFKNDFVKLQQAMADAAIESSNAQVKAYENAKNHAITANTSIPNSNDVSGNYGKGENSGDEGKNHISGGFDDSDIALVNPGYKPKPNVSKPSLRPQRLPSRYAEGGIVSRKDSHPLFDSIAKSMGEDHMVAVQNGEMILPADFPGKSSESSQFLEQLSESGRNIIRSSFLKFDSFSGSNTCNDLNFTGNDAQKNFDIKFGDIVLQGVQDPNTFGRDLRLYLDNVVTQELSKHR